MLASLVTQKTNEIQLGLPVIVKQKLHLGKEVNKDRRNILVENTMELVKIPSERISMKGHHEMHICLPPTLQAVYRVH